MGDPGGAARDAHSRAGETLATLVESGVAAAELDALARARLTFPDHTGHGLGTGWNEESRIVPGAATVLEEGMAVALEPGKLRRRWGAPRTGRGGHVRGL